MLTRDDIKAFKKICGKDAVLHDPVSLLSYENDAIRFKRCRPDCVVIPPSRGKLAELVGFCRGRPFPFTIRGAGTSLSGGPLADQGGLVIHLSRLQEILEINREDLYCVVEPGVVLNVLNDRLKKEGLYYPPDPSSGIVSTLGGNVAENAGGIRCFKYGVTANYVLGVEIILPDGRLKLLGGPAGGSGRGTGFRWQHLITGSEGTLAPVCRIWLRLQPLPEKTWTFLAPFRQMQDAMKAVTALTRHPAVPTALEFMDSRIVTLVESSPFAVGLDTECCYVLTEIDGPEGLVDLYSDGVESLLKSKGAKSVQKSCDPARRTDLWKARKAFGGLLGQLSPDLMSQDAVVPSTRIGEVLDYIYEEADKAGIRAVSVVHAGDGNMHPNLLFDADVPGELEKVERLGKLLMEKVVSCGGALSGEHGIGADKRAYIPMMFTEREVAFQMAACRCFNPRHQLNPGKIFGERVFRV